MEAAKQEAQSITNTKPAWKPFKFLNCTTKFKKIVNEKLHNEFIDQYEEIPPYARNESTGEILNNTNKYIYKKIEPRNIYKEIQSMAKEADIITKIRNMTPAAREEMAKPGVYLDTTKFGNLHEEHEKTNKLEQELAIAEKAYFEKQEELKKAKIIEQYKAEEAAKAAAAAKEQK